MTEAAFEHDGLERKLRKLLSPDEAVLWKHYSSPAPWWYAPIHIWGAVFSILWTYLVISMLWSTGAFHLALKHPLLFIFIGIFPMIGFAVISVSVWSLLRRKSFAYAITNRRVIVLNSMSPIMAKSFYPEKIIAFERYQDGNLGSIRLRNYAYYGHYGEDYWQNYMPASLIKIPNSHHVAKLIQDNLLQSPHDKSSP